MGKSNVRAMSTALKLLKLGRMIYKMADAVDSLGSDCDDIVSIVDKFVDQSTLEAGRVLDLIATK